MTILATATKSSSYEYLQASTPVTGATAQPEATQTGANGQSISMEQPKNIDET